MHSLKYLAAISLAVTGASAACAATYDIQGAANVQDAYVQSNNSTTNYNAGSIRLKHRTSSDERFFGLIRFDLPTLAPGESVVDAELKLDYFATDNATVGSLVVKLYRVLYAWEETQVSWNNRLTGTGWEGGNLGFQDGLNPPANYSATLLGSATLTTASYGIKTFESAELTDVLDQMAKGTLSNYGFILRPDSNSTNNGWYFGTADRTTTDAVKPVLTLTTEIPEPASLGLVAAGGLLCLVRRRRMA